MPSDPRLQVTATTIPADRYDTVTITDDGDQMGRTLNRSITNSDTTQQDDTNLEHAPQTRADQGPTYVRVTGAALWQAGGGEMGVPALQDLRIPVRMRDQGSASRVREPVDDRTDRGTGATI